MIADDKGQERILEQGESVNKEILKGVKSREVNSLVSSPRLASGNRLRENIQDSESLSEAIQFRKVCERIVLVPGIGWYEIQDQT